MQVSAIKGRSGLGKRLFSNNGTCFAPGHENLSDPSPEYIRNIGIIAHIDAGKTTTTERMLYYSGHTKSLGNVDAGSTVTDFLPAEQERGITIQSAAITFHWPAQTQVKGQKFTVNLIDTPGHADFTFEVLRSLRVLDGAVCILDGVAGVEAQTEKVWYQARAYGVPAIFFVNKLDRDGAAFGKTIRDIASKLRVRPAVCQIPWFENGNGPLQGVIDIIHLRALKWARNSDSKTIETLSLLELESHERILVEEAKRARKALIDLLSEHDESMVEAFIECEDYMAIAPERILASIRHCLLGLGSSFAPVLAGASLRNIGVQPVLDAITSLLPSPGETPDPQFRAGSTSGGLRDLVQGKIPLEPRARTEGTGISRNKKTSGSLAKMEKFEACALAFKVVYDRHRGVLVYVRVYHGSLRRNSVIFNTNLQVPERVPRTVRMYASDAVEVPSIQAGEIGVIPGLKYARTGDTLISYSGINPKNGPPEPLDELQLRPIDVPPPVFFASIEPFNQAEEKQTDELLKILLREDPSLQLSTNEDSGQKWLSGMGELHLEIAADRLIKDLRARATMGQIEIGYRECPTAPGPTQTSIYERQVAGKFGKAGCESTITLLEEGEADEVDSLLQEGNAIAVTIRTQVVEGDHSDIPLPGGLSPVQVRHALCNGALAALARGPAFTYQVHNARVRLMFDPSKHFFGNDTTLQALTSAARKATQAAMKASHEAGPFAMAEPVMNAIINVDDETLGAVLKDLTSSRDGQVISYQDEDIITGSGVPGTREDVIAIDLKKVYAPPDPFQTPSLANFDTKQISDNRARTITARVPLRAMVGYLKHLRSLTAGRGSFVMSFDRFQKMPSHTQKSVVKRLQGL
ncbi:MAG: hypothetical protein LQ340_005977 [Diploschistes diacapsis]|nr:MAG: hypothetical protein LQ340_005977 [Diploschistes diacapsis]